MRRSFQSQNTDWLYIDNMIGQAINELRNQRTLEGKLVHKHHNLSKIVKHLDEYHNIKVNNSSLSSLNSEDSKRASSSYKQFKALYTAKANNYVKAKGNNYTFTPVEKKTPFLLRAVNDLFRV